MPERATTVSCPPLSPPRRAHGAARAIVAASTLLTLALAAPALAQPAAGQPGAGGMRMAQPGAEPFLVSLLRALPEGTSGLIQIWNGDPIDGAVLMNTLGFVVGEGDSIPRISLPNGTVLRFRPFDGDPDAGAANQFTFELVLGSGEEDRFLEVVRALGHATAHVEIDVLATGSGGGVVRGPAGGQ